jgi:DNA primase
LHQAINAIREKNAVFIVEGYFDLLRLVDIGIKNVIASSGTAFSESQARLIKRYTENAIIAYDSDDAGLKAAIRNSQILETQDLKVTLILIPKPYDPDSFILEKGRNAFIDLIKNRTSALEYQLNGLQQKSKDLSIDEKNNLIDNLLEEYVTIPNDIKVGLYLHKIAEQLEITESFLISRFNLLKKRTRVRKEYKEDTQPIREVTIKKGQWRAEEDLLSIIFLDDSNVSKYIFEHISVSDFSNDNLREVFELLAHQWEEMGHLDLKEIENSSSGEVEMNLITKLSFQTINNPLKYAAGCIYKMRKWHLDSKYREILRLMREESASDKSKLHYTRELTGIREKLSEVEEDKKKFLNVDL